MTRQFEGEEREGGREREKQERKSEREKERTALAKANTAGLSGGPCCCSCTGESEGRTGLREGVCGEGTGNSQVSFGSAGSRTLEVQTDRDGGGRGNGGPSLRGGSRLQGESRPPAVPLCPPRPPRAASER